MVESRVHEVGQVAIAATNVSSQAARRASRALDSIMSGWADDAVMMPPGLPPLEGKAAIRGYVEAGMQLPGFTSSGSLGLSMWRAAATSPT